ncbi:caffeic acid 3-O-methyltransferase-like [Primulina huaijiensis]|uniref:caffeic acid 3-O-methyltransferase-like n=1 Tax=Primulina huaijiensis TaxID=1492673 RepID=UPI003CC72548
MEKQGHANYYKHVNHEDDDEAFLDCMVACGSHVLRLVLNASIQLNLFEIIDKSRDGAPVSAFEIASQLPTVNVERAARVLDSMLRVLVTQSFLTCSITDHASTLTELRFRITPKGKFLVANERGVSLAQFHALTVLQESTNWRIDLKAAVLEGINFFENAQPYYKDISSNPDSNKIFNNAMGSMTILSMKKILKVYKGFEGLRTLVNVGGGNGVTLDMIISKYPSISGVNLDLSAVIRTAPIYKGVKHVTGDMFAQVPKGDAILLKLVLHNWGDEQCVKILTNCYKALPRKGKVIVIESILPEIPQTDLYSQEVALLNIIMLSINGKERTKGEYEAMAMEAGFAEFKVVCRACESYVMELIKF